ncbi:unnamed protein product [marine sediment metagenome]|uniref:Uncharacterized protein n=1 Tax=marine sediment metagenome TaxID=412755 RepID=X0U6W5_9ZZZZ
MRAVLIALLSICLTCGVAFGGAANFVTGEQDHQIKVHQPESEIPNTTILTEDTNGRPQKLDKRGDEDGTDLNPTERRIIIRDAVISNRPMLAD